MTLLAQGTIPDRVLLEDANDLCNFMVALGRTVDPRRWTGQADDDMNEAMAASGF